MPVGYLVEVLIKISPGLPNLIPPPYHSCVAQCICLRMLVWPQLPDNPGLEQVEPSWLCRFKSPVSAYMCYLQVAR